MTTDDQERLGVDAAALDPEVPDPGVADGRSPRSLVRRLVRMAFLLIALTAAVWLVVSRRDEVTAALAQVSPAGFLLSTLAAVVAYFCPMLAWRRLLADLGSPLPLAPAARIFFLSQLGKYVPGSIWTVVAQVDLGRELQVPPRRSAAVALLALAVGLLGGVLTALVTLPFAMPELIGDYWWVLLAVPVLLGVLHPRVVAMWTGLLSTLTRRAGGSVQVGYRAIAVALGWTALCWLMLGVQLYLLLPSEAAATPSAFLLCAGLYALAWCAGFLAFVAPAGAGVREAVLVVGLAPFVPAGGALVVALLSRVVATLADVILAAGGVLAARMRQARRSRPA
jgi:glycosyltransferase 2 family protein